MTISASHPWDLTTRQARELQGQLRSLVVMRPLRHGVQRVAGLDVSADRFRRVGRAAAVVLGFPDLELKEKAVHEAALTFPYVPGLLSFRECPLLLEALAKLSTSPDLLLVDGQGYAHPRRFGLACHLGLLTGIPSIGCAKSRLCGSFAEPASERGAWADLVDGEAVIGSALRTRSDVKPVFVSVGHLVDLPSARRYVLHCTREYRVPEPLRLAHLLSVGQL